MTTSLDAPDRSSEPFCRRGCHRLDGEAAVLRACRARPSSNTTMRGDDVRALEVCETSMHSMRNGAVLEAEGLLRAPRRAWLRAVRSPARRSLVAAARDSPGVPGDGLHESERLSPRCGTRRLDPARPAARPSQSEPSTRRVRRAAPAPEPHGARRPRRCSPPYSWMQQLLDEVAGAELLGLRSTTKPRCPRTRPPRTWNTCTAASRGSSAKRDDVGVRAVAEHHRLLFSIARRSAPTSSRSRAALLEVKLGRGGPHHVLLEATGERGRCWPAMKAQKSSTIARCCILARPGPTQGAEHLPMYPSRHGRPTWPAAPEDPGRCRCATGNTPQQQVHGLADGPGVRVRAEVAHTLALRAAHDLDPRESPRPR